MNFAIIKYMDGHSTLIPDDQISNFSLSNDVILFTHYIQDERDEQGRCINKTFILATTNASKLNNQNGKVYYGFTDDEHIISFPIDDNAVILDSFEKFENAFAEEFNLSKNRK